MEQLVKLNFFRWLFNNFNDIRTHFDLDARGLNVLLISLERSREPGLDFNLVAHGVFEISETHLSFVIAMSTVIYHSDIRTASSEISFVVESANVVIEVALHPEEPITQDLFVNFTHYPDKHKQACSVRVTGIHFLEPNGRSYHQVLVWRYFGGRSVTQLDFHVVLETHFI